MRPIYHFKFIMWGFFLGIFLAVSIETGLFEIWHSLGKPPEEISSLIGSSGEAVYVQTKSGNTYKYDFLIYEHQRVSPMWKIETNKDYKLYSHTTNIGYFIIIPPLLWINQSLTIDDYLTVENGGIRRFVIAPDNSVWMWRHFSTGMGIVYLPIIPITGIVLGAIIALAWFVIQVITGHLRRR